jgi:hypothetical protein
LFGVAIVTAYLMSVLGTAYGIKTISLRLLCRVGTS